MVMAEDFVDHDVDPLLMPRRLGELILRRIGVGGRLGLRWPDGAAACGFSITWPA
jgi:hypothetical protein